MSLLSIHVDASLRRWGLIIKRRGGVPYLMVERVNRQPKALYSVLGKQYHVPGLAGVALVRWALNKRICTRAQLDPTFQSLGLVGLLRVLGRGIVERS